VDDKFHRNYVSTYHVCIPHWAGPFSAVQAVGIPAYGSNYTWGADFDLWAFATSYSAGFDPDENCVVSGIKCHKYEVIVTHTTTPTDYPSGILRDDPITYPPRISGSFANFSVPAYRDKDDAPVVNTATELFDNTPEIEDSHDTLNLEFVTPTINLAQRSDFRNSVNSEPIWGLGIRQVKLISWTYKILWYGATPYVMHNFEFHISQVQHPYACGDGDETAYNLNPAIGWYTTLPNAGYRELTGGSIVTILDDFDSPLNKPSDLDCDGAVSTEQKWIRYALEKERDFTTIPGMPDPLPGPFA
jgi:hypothetical protein